MNTVDYSLWKALQEIKDLQPGEVLYVERPLCAAGERVIITLWRPVDNADTSSNHGQS